MYQYVSAPSARGYDELLYQLCYKPKIAGLARRRLRESGVAEKSAIRAAAHCLSLDLAIAER